MWRYIWDKNEWINSLKGQLNILNKLKLVDYILILVHSKNETKNKSVGIIFHFLIVCNTIISEILMIFLLIIFISCDITSQDLGSWCQRRLLNQIDLNSFIFKIISELSSITMQQSCVWKGNNIKIEFYLDHLLHGVSGKTKMYKLCQDIKQIVLSQELI